MAAIGVMTRCACITMVIETIYCLLCSLLEPFTGTLVCVLFYDVLAIPTNIKMFCLWIVILPINIVIVFAEGVMQCSVMMFPPLSAHSQF